MFALLSKYATLPATPTRAVNVVATASVFALTLESAFTVISPLFWATTFPPDMEAEVLYFISVTSTPTAAAPVPPAAVALVMLIVSES